MPSELSKHVIGARGGPVLLLDWIAGHKFRNYSSVKTDQQLDFAKRIAEISSKSARELGLELLRAATYQAEVIEEMHKEMDTLHNALTKIESNSP